jgi:transposase
MEYFAGIDVSLEQSSVCVVDGTGKIVREAKLASEPEALVGFFRGLETGVTRIGPRQSDTRIPRQDRGSGSPE